MFILKLLFILMLAAAIYLLARTFISKFRNPEKPFIKCIPYMNEFSTVNADLDKKIDKTDVGSTQEVEQLADRANSSTARKPVSVKKVAKPRKTTKSTKKKVTKKRNDNIKKINGIGPVFEKKLNKAGINSFAHIANWSDADVEHFDQELNLGGRPQREEWVAKAKILAAAQTE